jgi:trimeric autotransporter adhesin
MKTTTPPLKHSVNRTSCPRALLLIPLAVACFALSPQAQATCQQGCLTNGNTVLGDDALISNTTGIDNTATGFQALFNNTIGPLNTATGFQALFSNTTGDANTATGYQALTSNIDGFGNTATGTYTLHFNTDGQFNTATGDLALMNNTGGTNNTATGVAALLLNTTGYRNTATGGNALHSNTTGLENTASGNNALYQNTTGNNNTATGVDALLGNFTGNNNTATGSAALNSNSGNNNTATGVNALFNSTSGENNTATGFGALANNTTGSNNIAVGKNAGVNLTSGSSNIDIGNVGVAGESKIIRIGKQGLQTNTYIAGISGVTVPTGVPVIVDADGHLGTTTSSVRFKEDIKPMDTASEAIVRLKPVTFRYKHDLDPEGIPQFGLVAEDVEKVNPDLVARDDQGKPYTVRYEAVNAMLLNEFLKEHRKVERLEVTLAQQRKDFEAAIAQLKGQIQKVSAQLELNKPEPRTVLNNR